MRRQATLFLFSSLAISFASCICGGGRVDIPCSTSADCGAGEQCINGKCTGPGGGAGGGGGGGGTVVTGCDRSHPDNAVRDTDCDGMTDADEYDINYGNNTYTDACNADTDADGVKDGVEMGRTTSVNATCGFQGDADSISKTDPTKPDSDGDGLKDGEEDKNANGKVEPGEANPLRKDSDCDGISDPDEFSGAAGCVTDPLKKDTDGDGLFDGVEQGVTSGADPQVCNYPASTFDQDAASKTNACNPDSDGDGIMDGAEDNNQNGRVDQGELNPNSNADGQGPAQQACSTANLKPISFHSSGVADVQVALVPSFAEVARLVEGATERGLIFYDAQSQIAGLVFSKAPSGSSATNEETASRATLNGVGTISGAIAQTFTTWDGFAQSVRASYDQAGAADLKTRINDIAKAFLGAQIGGVLPGTAGVSGPFKVQAEYVRRTAQRAVVLIAITPQSLYTGQQLFRLDDVGGGSALAQFGDFAGTQCEVFLSQPSRPVDFLWVIDDSGSMAASQAAVSNTSSRFAQKLQSAGLDWRAAGVTTYYWFNTNDTTRTAPFTNNAMTMQSFITGFGASYRGDERGLRSARLYITNVLLPKMAGSATSIRPDADLHLILLGDADDQDTPTAMPAGMTIAEYITFFSNYDNGGSKATVHGILCPAGQTCNGETQFTPRRSISIVQGTGGVLGDFNIAQSNNPQLDNTIDAILSAAIAGTGHQVAKPPISATIKVAIESGGTVGQCSVSDVPRDRTNGFDFDGASRRIVFFGNCRPSGPGKKVAVSYKFWNDGSPDPNGDPCGGKCQPPLVCNPGTGQCVCPDNCGGTCTQGQQCDMATCSCGPGIN